MTNAGVAQLTRLGGEASPELLVDVMSNGTMATLIILAMTSGLVVPSGGRTDGASADQALHRRG